MITNELLESKYRVQKQLCEEAGYDIRRYFENVQRIVAETEREHGVKFKYYPGEEKQK